VPRLLAQLLHDPDAQAFAVLRRADGPGVEVLAGDVVDVARLADIPLPEPTAGAPRPHVLAAVPYRQVTERGFACHDDGAPLRCLVVRETESLTLDQALELLPDEDPGVCGGDFDVDDEAYAVLVRRVVEEEIGRGEGANFVLRRDHLSTASAAPATTALRVLRRLLTGEPGAYWAFALSAGDLTMVGATPERHVSSAGGEVVMNPISGTYRFPPTGPTAEGLLAFLADDKEVEELFMVVDEELKMMSRVCRRGGQVVGPLLRQMSALAHTEYLLRGHSDLDVREVLRETMFAPTVTGSPVENAARVIARHEATGRGHYAGVLALIGQDDAGARTLDAPILIRTAYLEPTGVVRVPVGATLVRHSDPATEVAETHAKAAGVLRALGVRPAPEHRSAPRLADQPGVTEALARRNERLAPFWAHPQHDRPDTALAGRSAVVVDAQDAWTEMLAHLLRRLGMTATVRRWDDVDPEDAAADLLIAGPGPGDPRDVADPRIAAVHTVVRRRLDSGRPLLAVCLGHQVLAAQLGLPVRPLPVPHQGTQRSVDLHGRRVRVGYYNTFAAVAGPAGLPGVQIAAEPDTGEVHALRGPGFSSVQFHPESLLSPDGLDVLAGLARDLLLPKDLPSAVPALGPSGAPGDRAGAVAEDASVRIEEAAWDDAVVQQLAGDQQAEIVELYGGKTEPGRPPSAADISVVLVARDDDGTPLGCGALRALGDGAAEVKRMYVVPAARRRGVGRAVLAGLEDAARHRGWTTLRLETGPLQAAAVALYESYGYRPIPAFGGYAGDPRAVHSLFFERTLP